MKIPGFDGITIYFLSILLISEISFSNYEPEVRGALLPRVETRGYYN